MNDKKELEYNLDKVDSILQSKGIQTRRANSIEEDTDVTTGLLPTENENDRNPHPVQRYDVSSRYWNNCYQFLVAKIVLIN